MVRQGPVCALRPWLRHVQVGGLALIDVDTRGNLARISVNVHFNPMVGAKPLSV